MRSVRRARLTGSVVLLLVCIHARGIAAGEPADSERVQAELERLTAELNSLDTWLSRAEQRRLQLIGDLRATDRAVAAAANDVGESDAALAEISSERSRLEAERDELRERQRREAARIGEHLAAAYRMEVRGFVRLLLDQRSPAPMQRMLVYHRHLAAARLDALASYRIASTRLEQNAAALAEREAAQREERQRLAARRQELERSRGERRALVESLERDVQDRLSRRESLLRDQERLQALFAELQQRPSTVEGTEFADRKGSLPWPLDGVPAARFGQPRAGGRLMWQGLLLRAETGSPVRAVHRGRVVFADWLRGFGLLTILDHGDGYMTLYGHAETLEKRPGDLVESGEIIALAGQSGGVRTSGVYFEIRRHGTATDPLGWVVEGG